MRSFKFLNVLALLVAGCTQAPESKLTNQNSPPEPIASAIEPEVAQVDAASEEIIVIELDGEGEYLDWQLAGEVPVGSFSHSVPGRLQFSCAVGINSRESVLAQRLASGSSDDQLRAARLLWRGHSRRHADDVLKFSARSQSTAAEYLAFRKLCDDALQPAAIVQELRAGDYVWGAWLATLRPHADLVPELLKGLEERPAHLAETMVALGKSRDPRALEPLLKILNRAEYHDSGFAAGAIGELGLPEAEAPLLAALPGSGAWFKASICSALGMIGTKKSLPVLEEIAASEEYQGAIDCRGAAKAAIEQIHARRK